MDLFEGLIWSFFGNRSDQRRPGHKTNHRIALLTLAGILSTGTTLAQSYEVLLPGGNYTITSVSNDGIEIRNQEKHVAVLALAFPDGNQSENGGKLVFDKYAGQYFLREIFCESSGTMNVNLPSTKWEKRARMEEARIPNDGGRVLVATK